MKAALIIIFLLLMMNAVLLSAVNEVFSRAILMKAKGKRINADRKLSLNSIQKQNEFYVSAYEWFKSVQKLKANVLSHDGLKLCAFIIENNSSNRACLVIPGWTDKKEYMYAEAGLFYELGYTVLIPDQRCHGESEGQFVSFGANEKLDMSKWLELLKNKGYDDIVVFGRSMGAATAMLTTCFEKDTHIACAIEDSGYTSLYEQLSSQLYERMPWLSNGLSDYFMKLIGNKIRKKAGFDIDLASPVRFLPECKVPMLFIHGRADSFVPFEMMEDLYSAHCGEKERFVTENGEHVGSLIADTANYRKSVIAFLKKYGNLSEVENG